jgi:hypothetical protein
MQQLGSLAESPEPMAQSPVVQTMMQSPRKKIPAARSPFGRMQAARSPFGGYEDAMSQIQKNDIDADADACSEDLLGGSDDDGDDNDNDETQSPMHVEPVSMLTPILQSRDQLTYAPSAFPEEVETQVLF